MGARMACRSISKRKLRTPVDEGGRALGGGDHAPHAPAHKHRQPQLCEGGELFNRMVARGHYTERAAAVSRTIVEVVQVRRLLVFLGCYLITAYNYTYTLSTTGSSMRRIVSYCSSYVNIVASTSFVSMSLL